MANMESAINHIGLIPDGNRRWAHQNKTSYQIAYNLTMLNIKRFIELAIDNQISFVSVYLLSKDNLSRQREDLDAVIESETLLISDILPSFCEQNKCKVTIAGDLLAIPKRLSASAQNLQKLTQFFNGTNLYLLLGYDPFDEINSVIANEANKITIDSLWVSKNVDVVIRTAGGPTLLSKFLPLQSSYAQIYMVDKLFNDCTQDDILEIINKAKTTRMLHGK